ncbi:hypothetical protein [Fluviicola taffensis]|uniref:Uncharacterized protein n=1 Tax=Fluviicola taffensis (strain DSM 16823 / NCIMB 13979 / RW262) TaxID=755732 RepID=F2IJJ5_FLUTR|nr:hypothetical protein [Fluviicola taffensis]AEA42883.1 hypothetical protein Fluta_0882 [Fluviicola taffensis DSM 16823]
MKKSTIAILVGIIIGGLFVALGETLAPALFPPKTPYPTDPTKVADFIANDLPFMYKFVLVLNWGIAAFLAGILSTAISGRTSLQPMLASVAVLNILVLINSFLRGYPQWMIITSLFLFIPLGLIAYFLIRKKKVDENL